MTSTAKTRPVSESLREYGRGIAGGLIFSFPLLYTMEVWWTGFIAAPWQLVLVMLFTFVLLMGYNRYAGMHPDTSWKHIVIDSVEELGLGFLLACGVLLMLSRVELSDMSVNEIVGKVVIEAMVVSIGVSVGTAQLGVKSGQEEKSDSSRSEEPKGLLNLIILALCGSILVGGNVAPTEEIIVIAIEATPFHILVMTVVSLTLCLLIVFFVDFEGTASNTTSPPDPFTIALETCICYLVALVTSALLLWFFGRLSQVNFWTAFSQCVTLGVLSSLGASAGRLLIQ